MMEKEDLIKLKKQIDTAKTKVSELKGRQQHLMEQLKKDWKCSTVEDAKQKAEEMEAEITKLDKQIEKGIKELKEKYEFE